MRYEATLTIAAIKWLDRVTGEPDATYTTGAELTVDGGASQL